MLRWVDALPSLRQALDAVAKTDAEPTIRELAVKGAAPSPSAAPPGEP